ncbi:hypothetical protein NTGM5_170037 [Candidatus Nitrotoga sp. M5]|nr:hypothetical protein NTGM5_170037 [Candidatus Nitrotoga sp. M5]
MPCKFVKWDKQTFSRKVKAHKIIPRSVYCSLRFFLSGSLFGCPALNILNAGQHTYADAPKVIQVKSVP